MSFIKSLIIFIITTNIYAQVPVDTPGIEFGDDDLNIGGDIFSDFSEDLEASQIYEDERYYRFGRFFTFNIGIGHTTFGGNRGKLYDTQPPTYHMSLYYFFDFRTSFGMGIEFSRHFYYIGEPTLGFPNGNGVGFVDVNLLRPFFSYRYHIDTSDLGTALTYSNPYFAIRFEYWSLTEKFRDQRGLDDESGGGLGIGLGGGFEFPIKLRESYINVEFLWHTVNFEDKYDTRYQAVNPNQEDVSTDLTGDVYSVVVAYVFNW